MPVGFADMLWAD